jgi:hypothetical protein
MKTISAQDSSLLALLAEKPSSRSGLRRKILEKLSPEALNIATKMGEKCLISDDAEIVGTDAAATARGLKRWAETNKSSRRRTGARRKTK